MDGGTAAAGEAARRAGIPALMDGIDECEGKTEFPDLQVLLRKWHTANPSDGLPLYEDLVLGGLGRIANDVAIIRCLDGDEARLLRAGPGFEAIVQTNCFQIPLSDLADGFQLSFRLALKAARRHRMPALQLCRSCLDGMIASVEVVALPLASRWAGEFFLLFARARARQIELANLLVNSMHEGVMALSVLQQKDQPQCDFLILSINDAAADLFGQTAAALRSARLSDVLAKSGLECCMRELRTALTDGCGTKTVECDANGLSLQVGITVIDSLVTVTLTDVGELKARETLFRTMFDDNPVPMMLRCHHEQRLLRVNDAALRLYGYERERFLQLEPGALLPGEDDRTANARLYGETGSKAKRHRTADGSTLHVIEYEQAVNVDAQPATLTTIVDVTERTRAEAQITYLAHHDPLTGLANRTVFTNALEAALAHPDDENRSVAVISIDLDGFKLINDTLGHDAGDQLLVIVAQRLQTLIRSPDVIARVGGDEFAVIAHDCRSRAAAAGYADMLKEALIEPHRIDGREIRIGASMGIALAPLHTDDLQQLLKYADLALYRAKRDTGSAYRFFELRMDRIVSDRRQLEMDLRRAVFDSEFELHYQPILAVQTGVLRGFEALMRWNHPERGRVSPEIFISLAEEIGVIDALGDWAVREACREAANWPAHLIIAVNVSAMQFSGGKLIRSIDDALSSTGLTPDRLEIEITESVLLNDTEENIAILRQLSGRGIRVALDDFGTGYSSMGYLTKFPFSRIKIDRSFISELECSDASRAIVRAIIELASGFGMAITAEGVETVSQFEMLRDERCSELQGFLFSPPIASSCLTDLLRSYGLEPNRETAAPPELSTLMDVTDKQADLRVAME